MFLHFWWLTNRRENLFLELRSLCIIEIIEKGMTTKRMIEEVQIKTDFLQQKLVVMKIVLYSMSLNIKTQLSTAPVMCIEQENRKRIVKLNYLPIVRFIDRVKPYILKVLQTKARKMNLTY